MRKLSRSDRWFLWWSLWRAERKKIMVVLWMAVGFLGFFGFLLLIDNEPHYGRPYGFYFAKDPQFTGSHILVPYGRIPYRSTR